MDGVTLEWSEGNVWVAELPLQSGQQYEFKAVLYNDTTKAQNSAALQVVCEFGKPNAMTVTPIPVPGGAAKAATANRSADGNGSGFGAKASEPAASAMSVPDGCVMADISIQYEAGPNEVVKLVGGSDEMGQWNAANGLELAFTADNTWALSKPLPCGQQYEFKAVVVNSITKEQK
eukprot:gene14447-20456_t